MRLTFILTIIFSLSAHARTLVDLPEPHQETLSLTEVRQFIDTSKLRAEKETDIGWLAFDVTQGIRSRDAKSAHVTLFSNQSEITNFSVSVVGFGSSEGSKQIIAFPLNSSIVTHIKIRLYCSENYIYDFEVALNALELGVMRPRGNTCHI